MKNELDAKCYNFNVKLNRSNIRMSGVNIDMLLLNTSFLAASASDEAKFAEKNDIILRWEEY